MNQITFIFKGGRLERLLAIKKGSSPSDFFYGSYELKIKNYKLKFISINNIRLNKFLKFYEFILSNINKLGITKILFKSIKEEINSSKLIISFTDGLSLSLGYLKNKNVKTLGCFHSLSDLENKSNKIIRPWSRYLIKKSLDGLDHVAFFGPKDRDFAIKRYGLKKEKTSIIVFGVDIKFWKPTRKQPKNYFFSLGQDPSRDFETLIKTKTNYTIKIHTDLNFQSRKKNIIITKGNYYKNGLSDLELKKMYQNAIAVIIPLKDVYQPGGYSVALQAMSCGKPVIISKTRGFWAPDLFINYKNCIFVKPGSTKELDQAINLIYTNVRKRNEIGRNARVTIEKNFNSKNAKQSLTSIINRIIG